MQAMLVGKKVTTILIAIFGVSVFQREQVQTSSRMLKEGQGYSNNCKIPRGWELELRSE